MRSDTTPFILHSKHKDLEPGQFPQGFTPLPNDKTFTIFVASCTLVILILLVVVMYESRMPGTFESLAGMNVGLCGMPVLALAILVVGIVRAIAQSAFPDAPNQNVVLKGTIVALDYDSATHNLVIDYRFISPRKRTLRGRDKAHRPDLRTTVPPHIGTPVYVLYTNSANYDLM